MRNVAAVILAAGGSSRLGRPKQLLIFHGETLIRRSVRAAAGAGCDPVIVVVGNLGDTIQRELRSTSTIVVENPEWQRGLGTSVRRGLQEVGDSIDAVVLLTCDQPLVDKTLVAELITVHEKIRKPMVAASYANTLGVPALFDRSCFADLLALPNDSGAKKLITSRPNDVATVPFEQGAIDIDTPEDFERLTAK
ncbi:MAG: NTP transferase domain-containing protein [Chthoniobacterales bacterium]|jgi:molybdenum cofactor cytidylyltransferase